ncbi:MAG: MCE family protein [Bacteriovoracaceae bacterium]|nr:MCE family protein [Bacteriovoracaceae bacterium]
MNEFKVGLLAIATMVAVVYMSLKITTDQSGFGDYITYKTIIDDASGIFEKTPIKVAGINAGRIKSIELQGNQALISFEVLEKVKISNDSKLRVKTVGFLGDKYLEIVVGISDIRLGDGKLIDSEEAGGIANLARDASELMKEVKDLVKDLKTAIVPDGEESPIRRILLDLKELSANAKESSVSFRRFITSNEKKLGNIVSNLEGFSERLNYHMREGNKDAAMADIKQILADAKTMMSNMDAIVTDIRKGKGTMGKFLVEEQIADEVKQTLASVNKIVGKMDSIRTELSVYTGADSENGGVTEAGLRVFPSPERFYLFGITTSKFGPMKEKETTTIEGGSESKVITKNQEKNSYRFNVQLGRKIHNWVFRGGLIESTGGIGVDYEFSGKRYVIGGEVYDYDENDGVNVRLFSDFLVWNVLYGKLAVQNFTRKTTKTSFSAFAGLKFTDEDLKSILGFFF